VEQKRRNLHDRYVMMRAKKGGAMNFLKKSLTLLVVFASFFGLAKSVEPTTKDSPAPEKKAKAPKKSTKGSNAKAPIPDLEQKSEEAKPADPEAGGGW